MILRLFSFLLITIVFLVPSNGVSNGDVAIDAETGATVIIDGVSGATGKVDAVSGATRPEFSTWVFVEGEKLQLSLNEHNAAYILSTTNPDGTPHASAILPEYTKENTIKFALAHNRTRNNIDRSGLALLTVYSIECSSGTHSGARILLKRKGVVNADMMNTKGMRAVSMEIGNVISLID